MATVVVEKDRPKIDVSRQRFLPATWLATCWKSSFIPTSRLTAWRNSWEDALLRQPWSKAEDILSATLVARPGGARFQLIAERLPADNGWDWTVWRPGDAPENSRHGYGLGCHHRHGGGRRRGTALGNARAATGFVCRHLMGRPSRMWGSSRRAPERTGSPPLGDNGIPLKRPVGGHGANLQRQMSASW